MSRLYDDLRSSTGDYNTVKNSVTEPNVFSFQGCTSFDMIKM